MNDLLATTVLILLFALRCMLPLVLTLLIGYSMNRLVTRWQAEEQASMKVETCWETKNCPPEQRDNCPVYRQTGVACWQVKQQLTGVLPQACLECPLYTPKLA